MQTALGYIATQLKDPTNLGWFTKEWSRLTDVEKTLLKKWAVEEITVLGLT